MILSLVLLRLSLFQSGGPSQFDFPIYNTEAFPYLAPVIVLAWTCTEPFLVLISLLQGGEKPSETGSEGN